VTHVDVRKRSGAKKELITEQLRRGEAWLGIAGENMKKTINQMGRKKNEEEFCDVGMIRDWGRLVH